MKFYYPEAATPIDDISGLKPQWVKTQEDLNHVEAENITKAINKYLLRTVSSPENWFNVQALNKIHKDMFLEVWDWAGKFRKTQTIPGIRPYQILHALESLCRDVYFWWKEKCQLTSVEQAAEIHHRLTLIHPYPNGNGRFSRLVSDRYLKACQCSFPNWPSDINRDGQCRKNYIHVLKLADAGERTALIEYMVEYGAQELKKKPN